MRCIFSGSKGVQICLIFRFFLFVFFIFFKTKGEFPTQTPPAPCERQKNVVFQLESGILNGGKVIQNIDPGIECVLFPQRKRSMWAYDALSFRVNFILKRHTKLLYFQVHL